MFECVWVDFKILQMIILDQDNMFLSTFWSSLWLLLDTKLTKSTAFYPQTNGKIEVVNRMAIHILHTCMTPNIHAHGMTSFLMFDIDTRKFFIALLGITLSWWDWGFNHWAPMMSLFLLHSPRNIIPMIKVRLTNNTNTLDRFNLSTNSSMIFCRKPMLSISNTIINKVFHTCFRCVTRSSCIS